MLNGQEVYKETFAKLLQPGNPNLHGIVAEEDGQLLGRHIHVENIDVFSLLNFALSQSQYIYFVIAVRKQCGGKSFQRRPRPKAAGPLSTNHQLLFRRSHSSILPLLPLENRPC